MSWYKGSAGKITITTTETFTEMIVLVIHRTQRGIAAQFAYPARVGYTTLVKLLNDYSAVMTEAQTLAARTGPHNVEVKLFMAGGLRPVGIAEMSDLDSSEVGKIAAT